MAPEHTDLDTRERILNAARSRFLSQGVEATTMRRVAADVQLSATAIYHHFRDKDALLEELCLRDFRALAVALQRIGRIEDPAQRVLRMGLAYVDFALDHPEQYRFMFMATRPVPPMDHDKHGNPDEDAYAFLRETCAEGIARSFVRWLSRCQCCLHPGSPRGDQYRSPILFLSACLPTTVTQVACCGAGTIYGQARKLPAFCGTIPSASSQSVSCFMDF